MIAIPESSFRGLLPSIDSSRMHLCDIVQFHSPISGGIRRYINDKARFLARYPEIRHTVILPGERDKKWTEGNTEFLQIRSPLIPGSKSYRSFTATGNIRAHLDTLMPDLIEVADPYQSAWTAMQWARGKDSRVALFYHSDYPRAWHRTLRRWHVPGLASLFQHLVGRYLQNTFAHADAVLLATGKFHRYWRSRIQTPVFKVGLGFDPLVFHPSPVDPGLRSLLGIPSERPLVLYAGRFAPEKRLHLLLESFRRLKPQLPSAELLMVGDGEDKERLQRLDRTHALNVRWMPFCADTSRLAAIYASCDVYAHPGHNETFGFTVTEALACGTPVVSFHNSGLEEACANASRSVLVREGDLDAFANALKTVLCQPHSGADRLAMHETLRMKASLEVTLPALFAAYRSIIANPSRAIASAA